MLGWKDQMWAKKDKIILCRYCKQPFTPTPAQLKCWDYRCQPCRYKYVQKPYEEKHPGYAKEWKRQNREPILEKRRQTYKQERANRSSKKHYGKKARIIQAAKDCPCIDCGITYPSFIMHFDHRNPSQKFRNVSAMATYSEKRIRMEIAKCDVVCANCHGLRTLAGMKSGKIKMNGGHYV